MVDGRSGPQRMYGCTFWCSDGKAGRIGQKTRFRYSGYPLIWKKTYAKKHLQLSPDFEYRIVEICEPVKSYKALTNLSYDMGVMMPKEHYCGTGKREDHFALYETKTMDGVVHVSRTWMWILGPKRSGGITGKKSLSRSTPGIPFQGKPKNGGPGHRGNRGVLLKIYTGNHG